MELDEPSERDLTGEPQITQERGKSKSETKDSRDEAEDFGRIEKLDDDYKDYLGQTESYRRRAASDESDAKFEAIKNTVAPSQSLNEYLTEQWDMVDASQAVKNAGSTIIDYINDKGYMTVRLEQLHNKDKKDFTMSDLEEALKLVQKLEPAGTGARDLKECLLIQIEQSGDDMTFERRLIAEHFGALLENRLPYIAKKMNCSLDAINHAISRLSKLDTSPGLQIGPERNHPVIADVIVEAGQDPSEFSVRLADSNFSGLRINENYLKMSQDVAANDNTKKFLQNNIRSAQWIIIAIEQRRNTLLKVTKSVVRNQLEFFEKGQLYLKPLPMSKIAQEVGVHVATVSRAVAGKYVQCSWGIMPLRKFFSGGTEDDSGTEISWESIRVKLQQIIDSEDKTKPLSDDKILKKLAEAGINNLARRTIAKYRKLLNIPATRFRKKY